MDEKGRLFGRINIVDFTIILSILLVIPILYLGYKFSARDLDANVSPVSIQARFSDIMPELLSVIKPGDVEMDHSGKVTGRMTYVFEAIPSEVVVLRGDNQLAMKISDTKKSVSVKIDIMCKKKGGLFYYKEQPVKIGEEIVFSTNLYTLKGVIIGVEVKK